ncbi:hypothetical protein [Paenibacillus apiarius]|uniref:Uncharacterized protein n=1 Tax=Paenibacillus apiarius TaxID=46240 RepID=A0ABT4E004_9BACL|nr:hypothetical protein [Paenibacillus apiarius]MCY9517816.1 hypothetical protein [Paenibacillus apiarius]MCY9522330.1 hypothetical protein [Paenibacillus apiarius]MCY9555109.1 hypothetical protein [Paenibacillus apiarius]MCY9558201.1 hypothetical protein [Paenibacillus apiarius]MCY9684601.1 hypothetical protein [Paenibacillus apiarius]
MCNRLHIERKIFFIPDVKQEAAPIYDDYGQSVSAWNGYEECSMMRLPMERGPLACIISQRLYFYYVITADLRSIESFPASFIAV